MTAVCLTLGFLSQPGLEVAPQKTHFGKAVSIGIQEEDGDACVGCQEEKPPTGSSRAAELRALTNSLKCVELKTGGSTMAHCLRSRFTRSGINGPVPEMSVSNLGGDLVQLVAQRHSCRASRRHRHWSTHKSKTTS